MGQDLRLRAPQPPRQGEGRLAIVAKDNGTQVTIQPSIGVTVPTLNQGQSFEFETTADFIIQASSPVMVAQYMASSYATMTKRAPLARATPAARASTA